MMVSGKYRGQTKCFNSLKVVCFSNHFPSDGLLSADRWDIICLGEGDFSDLDRAPIIRSDARYPFKISEEIPNLNDSFDLFDFLEENLTTEPPRNECSATNTVAVSMNHSKLRCST